MEIQKPEGFEDYLLQPQIIDLKKANKFGLWVAIPTSLLYFIPYYLVWGQFDFSNNWGLHPLITLFLYPLINLSALIIGIIF